MTYPPQQSGPGGWDPHGRGGAGEADQQQPNWYGNQHASWPQPDGEQPPPARPLAPGQQGPPTQAPQPGQQTPPPPDWTGAGFGQPARPHEPFGFEDVTPAKRRSRLPWVFGGLALVLIAAAAVTAYLVWFTGPGSARPVAEKVVAKVNAGDLDALSSNLCSAKRSSFTAALAQLDRAEFDVRLGRVTTQGETATAELVGTYSLGGASHPVDQTIGLIVEQGQWKVCDLDT